MSAPPELRYKGTRVYLRKHEYTNGRMALVLVDDRGLPYYRVTINLTDYHQPTGTVFVKNWSENEGMLDWLVENDIGELTGHVNPSGFVEVPILKLNDIEPFLADHPKEEHEHPY